MRLWWPGQVLPGRQNQYPRRYPPAPTANDAQRTLPRSLPLLQHLPATSTQISVWIFKFLSLLHCVLYREDSEGPLQADSLSPRPGFWTIAVQGRCLTGSSLQGQGSFRAMATGYARAGHHCSLAVVLVVVVGLYRESA